MTPSTLFEARISRGTTAGDLELRRALQHDLDWFAAGFLRELRRGDAPGIVAELAAEAATDVLLLHAHVGRGNFQCGSDLLADAGDVLSGEMKQQAVLVGPLGDAAVSFKTAVSDDWRAIETFGDDFGLLKCFCGIALGGLGRPYPC